MDVGVSSAGSNFVSMKFFISSYVWDHSYCPMRNSISKSPFASLSNRGYVSGVHGPVDPGRLCTTEPPKALCVHCAGIVFATPELDTR